MSRRIRLGESLVAEGLINTGQLEEALARTASTGERIGEALVALGYITERDLVRTLARDAEIPFLESGELQVEPGVLLLIDSETASRGRLIPLRADGRALVVAMCNPFDISVIRSLESMTGRKIRPVTGDPAAIMGLVEARYGGRRSGASMPRRSWSSLGSFGSPPSPESAQIDAPATIFTPRPPESPMVRQPAAGSPANASIWRAGASPRRPFDDRSRTFAALVDQDSIALLEYTREAAGFRVTDLRSRRQRFTSADAALDALAEMLRESGARTPRVTVAVQGFGTLFRAMIAPTSTEEELRSAILADVGSVFGSADSSVTYAVGTSDASSSPIAYVAAMPTSLRRTIASRLHAAKATLEGVTLPAEAFRHLYRILDGSSETTAVLVCRRDGPHVAFFVNGHLELAVPPAPASDEGGGLDTRAITDQLDRSAVFLRQHSRGAVATRLLLSAPAEAYDDLASAIEARTGMRVTPFGVDVGSPDAVLAMGCVIAMRATDGLDLFPSESRSPRSGSSGSLLTATLATAAAVAAMWAGMQVMDLRNERRDLAALQSRVEQSMPVVERIQRDASARILARDARVALRESDSERSAWIDVLQTLPVSQPGVQLDTIRIVRRSDGMHVSTYGRDGRSPRLASFVTPVGDR